MLAQRLLTLVVTLPWQSVLAGTALSLSDWPDAPPYSRHAPARRRC
jgi:hypothetical protein